MSKAIIVVDMQNDFVFGTLANRAAEDIIPNIRKLLDDARANDDYIFYTRDTHDYSYSTTQEGKHLPIEHCIYGTPGWQVVSALEVMPTFTNKVYHIDKNKFGFDDWIAYSQLGEVEEIIVCGTVTSICVLSQVVLIKAAFPETPIKVYANCCADLNSTQQVAALTCMKAMQVEVVE